MTTALPLWAPRCVEVSVGLARVAGLGTASVLRTAGASCEAAEVDGVLGEVSTVVLDHLSDIRLLVLCDCTQNRYQLQQLGVVQVLAVPVRDFDAVIRASAPEILLEVVNDYGPLDVAAQQAQVLD